MVPVYRFAPSPTGFLHVGGARTAIFNWLLARKAAAKFLLRIEDTDRTRSTDEFIRQIESSLQWLGITWDEPPFFQSRRIERHQAIVRRLLESGRAYRCYCTREELEAKRERALARKEALQYDGTCRRLSSEEQAQKVNAGIPFTVRLKTAGQDVIYEDGIHGPVQTSGAEIDDFVILRSDGTPVYQIAVVVDDHDMGVTHVIRGDDHLSNTPKQILIYQSLDWPVPEFGHLPLILGPDRNRLSKRHGATSVEEFREQGILPEALFNYLCLLGWSPGDDREIMTVPELIEAFDTDRINKSGAVFDHKKLIWMNSKYLAAKSPVQLLEVLNTRLSETDRNTVRKDHDRALLLMGLLRERAATVLDLEDGSAFFFNDPPAYDEAGAAKHFNETSSGYLLKIRNALQDTDRFYAADVETVIRNIAAEEELGAGKLIHPLRLALTGRTNSPGIFEVLEVLGKETVLRRIDRAVEYIRAGGK